MPLERAASDGEVAESQAVDFEMYDPVSDGLVTVTVAKQALQKLGHSRNVLEVFQSHRAMIEQTASRKFDRTGGGKAVQLFEEDFVPLAAR